MPLSPCPNRERRELCVPMASYWHLCLQNVPFGLFCHLSFLKLECLACWKVEPLSSKNLVDAIHILFLVDPPVPLSVAWHSMQSYSWYEGENSGGSCTWQEGGHFCLFLSGHHIVCASLHCATTSSAQSALFSDKGSSVLLINRAIWSNSYEVGHLYIFPSMELAMGPPNRLNYCNARQEAEA